MVEVEPLLYDNSLWVEDKIKLIFENLAKQVAETDYYILHLTYLKWILTKDTEEVAKYIIDK